MVHEISYNAPGKNSQGNEMGGHHRIRLVQWESHRIDLDFQVPLVKIMITSGLNMANSGSEKELD